MKDSIKTIFKKLDVKTVFLLALIEILVFYNIFNSFMYTDEFLFTYKLSFYHGWGVAKGIFDLCMTSVFAPVSLFMNWLCYTIFGLWNPGYFIPNYLFNLANSILVYFLANKLLKDTRAALFAAFFFACFAGYWEALGSSAVLHIANGTFFVTTLIFWIDKKYLFACSMFILSCLTHETSVVAVPAVLFLYEWQVKNRGFKDILKAMRFIIFIAVAFLIFKVFREMFFLRIIGTGLYHFGWHFFKYYIEYVSLLILPIITSYRSIRALPPIFLAMILLLRTVLVTLVVAMIVYFLRKDKGILKFLLFSMLLILIPYSFIDLPVVSRYLYEPSMFYSVLMGCIFYVSFKEKAMIKMAVIIFLFMMLVGNSVLSLVSQKVFYAKKEVRRQILTAVQNYCPMIDKGKKLLFVDLPIRDDEIRYMLYLWYKNDGFVVDTVNANYVSKEPSNVRFNKALYDLVFVYDVRIKTLKMVKSPN